MRAGTPLRQLHSTTEKAQAIQWLKPEQTFGKKDPYCFTQAQAILARSMLPCQVRHARYASRTFTNTRAMESPFQMMQRSLYVESGRASHGVA